MPDTTVKIFNSSMAGAPTIGGSVGSLIAVLDACLKDGFGLKSVDSLVVSGGVATANISTGHSAIKDAVVLVAGSTVTGGSPGALNGEKKVFSITGTAVSFDATGIADQTATGTITLKLAPAGWSKTYSGTNLAAYKANNVSATGCLLRVDDTGTTNARVVGYESMTDVNTGSGPFPTAAQQSGGLYWGKASNTTGTRSWWVVANDRFFYIGIARHATYQSDYINFCFGDIASLKSPDAYRAYIAGATSDQGSNNPGASAASDYPAFYKSGTASPYCAMPRSYTQLGGSIIVNSTWNGLSGATSGQPSVPYQYPNGPDNGLLLDNVSIYENTSTCLRGKLPGVLACMQAIGANLTHDGYITGIPTLTDRSFLWKNCGSPSPTSRGGFAIDVTGPWAT